MRVFLPLQIGWHPGVHLSWIDSTLPVGFQKTLVDLFQNGLSFRHTSLLFNIVIISVMPFLYRMLFTMFREDYLRERETKRQTPAEPQSEFHPLHHTVANEHLEH